MIPPVRIEKLRDAKGIYGYGILGVDKHRQHIVVLRPDRIVPDHSVGDSWLQQVPPLNLVKKKHVIETDMVKSLADGFMVASGAIRPYDEEWPGLSDAERKKFTGHYWAAMARSRRITNSVIREVIADAADPEIVRLARRFPIDHRYHIYRYIARSKRAAQMAAVNPFLALVMYRPGYFSSDYRERAKEARAMVLAGKRLRDIEGLMRVPRGFRKVQPGATSYVAQAWAKEFTDHLPMGTRAQRTWLTLMAMAGKNDNHRGITEDNANEIATWTARNAAAFGMDWKAAKADFSNIIDWIDTSFAGGHLCRRPFSSDMSLATVRELSAEWHYAVAMADHRSDAVFPEPWLPGRAIGGYTFEPVRTPLELFVAGRELHNCLATYVDRISFGSTFIYSVRKGNSRIAALALTPGKPRASIEQMAGPCNMVVPKDVWRAARRFVRQPLPETFYEQQRKKIMAISVDIPFAPDGQTTGPSTDDEIPF